ncbi:MAG: hypothetical protein OEV40_10660 [Acidimicrobiia bacterium]|nr:hypothetical protein [Acidimicrobiia bacterium]
MTDDLDRQRVEELIGAEAAGGGSLRSRQRLGLLVAVGLAVLTLVEYVIAVTVDDPLIWLLPFVIAKGALIMEYFMHFSSLFGGGEH